MAPAVASAEQTEIIVRVLAKDSKFVGTSMGGMRIILRDAHTSEIPTSAPLLRSVDDQ